MAKRVSSSTSPRQVTDEGANGLEAMALVREIATILPHEGEQYPADTRNSRRVPGRATVYIRRCAGERVEAGLIDLSVGGALIESDAPLVSGEHVVVQLLDLPTPIAAEVRCVRAEMTHLAFIDLDPDSQLALARQVEHRATLTGRSS